MPQENQTQRSDAWAACAKERLLLGSTSRLQSNSLGRAEQCWILYLLPQSWRACSATTEAAFNSARPAEVSCCIGANSITHHKPTKGILIQNIHIPHNAVSNNLQMK